MANNQQVFRSVTGKDTIPSALSNANQLLNGSVTTDTLNLDQLIYSGTSNLEQLLNKVQEGLLGSLWLYVPDATGGTILAKVVSKANTATNTWTIILDRPMPSAAAAPAYWIVADLKKYVVTNTGNATGKINGQTIPVSAFPITVQMLWNYKMETLDCQTIDGSGTTLLIQEER